MDLSKEEMEELIAVFRAEAEDYIKSLAKSILSLDTCDEEGQANLLKSAFRDAHSLKGAASTLGFDRIMTVTHQLENLFEKLQRRKEKIESEMIDLLLETVEVIQHALESSSPGDSELTPEESQITKRLGALMRSESLQATSAKRDLTFAIMKRDKELLITFRQYSTDYIQKIFEILMTLKEGTSNDPIRLINNAAEMARGLVLLAETMNHKPVFIVSSHITNTLTAMGNKQIAIEQETIMLLLNVLNIALEATQKDREDVSWIKDEDSENILSLEELLEKTNKDTDARQLEKQIEEIKQEKTVEVDANKEKTRESKKSETEFVRIAEDKLDAVIAQADELFEVNLQFGSFKQNMALFQNTINEIERNLRALVSQRDEVEKEKKTGQVLDQVHGLSIQMKAASKKFGQDEQLLSKLVGGTKKQLNAIRLAPISSIYVMVRSQVRKLSKTTNKPVDLNLASGEHAVDRRVLEAIEAPLNHIIRNAIDHGIEDAATRSKAGKPVNGKIDISTHHTGDAVYLEIADDGRGIDHEKIRNKLIKQNRASEKDIQGLSREQLIDFLFEAGFTTKEDVTNISGRGVGMDVVKSEIESLGGEVRVNSVFGKGTSFTLRRPVTMSTLRCLLVKASSRIIAIPAHNIEKVFLPRTNEFRQLADSTVVFYKGENLPLFLLSQSLGLTSNTSDINKGERIVLVISFGERRVAFFVDDLVEYAQIIIKPLGDLLQRVPNISGISVLKTGEFALVLNPGDLVRAASGKTVKDLSPKFISRSDIPQVNKILVVDDSIATRTLEKTILESAGFEVLAVSDGYQALQALAIGKFDLIITDIQMPNMDGFELTKTIKSSSEWMHLPVILVSALGSDQDKAKGLASGADAYIVKSDLTQEDLVDTIHQLL